MAKATTAAGTGKQPEGAGPTSLANPPLGADGGQDITPGDGIDRSPRIYDVLFGRIARSEGALLRVEYAAHGGIRAKSRLFSEPVTALALAQSLLEVDSW